MKDKRRAKDIKKICELWTNSQKKNQDEIPAGWYRIEEIGEMIQKGSSTMMGRSKEAIRQKILKMGLERKRFSRYTEKGILHSYYYYKIPE